MRLTIQEIQEATNGTLVIKPHTRTVQATGVTWDSRAVQVGDLYLSLVGQRADGHQFVGSAAQSGAACALISHDLSPSDEKVAVEHGMAVIKVASVEAALEDLAALWRTRIQGRVIGLTGSTGKTTTKNLVRDVLSTVGEVVATAGNQNNELGVPKTLLSCHEDTPAVVIEMGMRGAGQIAHLCSYVRPDWGLITNVGESHIELLGSRANIARAKAELFETLSAPNGIAFVNVADDYTETVCSVAELAARGVRAILFDGTPDAEWRRDTMGSSRSALPAVWASDIVLDRTGRPTFTLKASGFEFFGAHGGAEIIPCTLQLRGLHAVVDACAAAAVGRAFGVTLEDCAAALAQAQPEQGRQEFLEAPGGFTVINDAYNANPDSMHAALATFAAIGVPGKHIAVLGDMNELGSTAPRSHRRIGTAVASHHIDVLICTGTLAQSIVRAALKAGMDPAHVVWVPTTKAALNKVKECVAPGDAVLIKASNSLGFDSIVEGLVY